MSKKAKQASKAKNLMEKRRRKLSNRSKYDEWARLGMNTKSKRNKKTKDKKTKGQHLVVNCGNLACNRCFRDIIRKNKKGESVRIGRIRK